MVRFLFACLLIVSGGLLHSASVNSQTDIRILAIEWSPDGTRLATGNSIGDIEIWNVDGEMLINTLHGHTQEIMALKWSPNGTWFASGSPDGTVRIWDAVSGEISIIIQFAQPNEVLRAILDIDWSPDSRFIAGARETGSVFIWNALTGQQYASYSHDGMALTVAWNPSGNNIVASGGSDGKVLLWDMTNQSLREFSPISTQDIGSVYSIAWSPDGDSIAVGGGRSGLGVGVQVFDFSTQELLSQIPHASSGIVSLRWSANRNELAIGDLETVSIVDSSTGQVMDRFNGNGILESFAWSPYGGRLAIRNADYQAAGRLGSAVQILVPDPSSERLRSIAEMCGAPLTDDRRLDASIAANDMPGFIAQVEALPEGTIPPACAADLIAVAEAIQGE